MTWLRSSPSMNHFIDCSAQTRCLNLGDHPATFKRFHTASAGSGRTKFAPTAVTRTLRGHARGLLSGVRTDGSSRPLPVIRAARRRHANDRLQRTAVIARRPFEEAHSPKRSPTVVQRWSASDAGRTSAVRAAELELPTHNGPTRRANRRPKPALQRREQPSAPRSCSSAPSGF